MISSRDISELHPKVQSKVSELLAKCKKEGIEILIYSTYRDVESQNALYAQGRTKAGKIVTNAKGGQSYHNYRVAFDFVPIFNGKPLWNDNKAITKVGEIGESIGLSWAGRWKSFKEKLHFQYTEGLTLKDFQEGKTL
jgi:peptidoglycan L-alanyl-D-glutamate endopeptidase CwlK